MANPFLLGPLAVGGLAVAQQIGSTATTKEKPTNTGKDGDFKITQGKNILGQSTNVYWKWDGKDWKETSESEYKAATGVKEYATRGQEPDAESVSSAVRYPADLSVSSDSDYVLFEFYEYQPPFKGVETDINKTPGEVANSILRSVLPGFGITQDLTQGALKSIGLDASKSYASQSLALYNQTNDDSKFYKKTSRSSVIMYMPEDISTGYQASWTGKKFSNLGRDALKTAGSDNPFKGIENAVKGAQKSFEEMVPVATNKLIRETISSITGESIGVDDVFGATRGVILNPNVELLFTGHDLRNFQLNYKLVPRNATEAANIKKIINTFRAAMLPNFANGSEIVFGNDTTVSQNFIKVPNVCKISFMRGGDLNSDVPQYKMCAMTKVDINYTPDGTYATYKDGTMVAYELQLSFQETKLIFSSEVEKY